MASQVFTAIQTQIQQVVDNTDINMCQIGMRQFSQSQLPAAMVNTVNGFPKLINNGEYHMVYDQMWSIVAEDPDVAQEEAEKVMWLFLQSTQRAALTALGVVGITLKLTDSPIITPVSNGMYEVYIEFEFRVVIGNPF